MRQLEPRACECVCKLIGILEEPARDLFVSRVKSQREVRRQHSRSTFLRRVESVGNRFFAALGDPLLGTRRTFFELPFVIEEILEKVITPLGRGLRPCDLGAAGDRVSADAGPVLALPAEALG